MNQILKARHARLRENRVKLPFGILAALLTASFVMLIGVVSQVDPFVIAMRSLASAVLIGLLVSVGIAIVRTANHPSE